MGPRQAAAFAARGWACRATISAPRRMHTSAAEVLAVEHIPHERYVVFDAFDHGGIQGVDRGVAGALAIRRMHSGSLPSNASPTLRVSW